MEAERSINVFVSYCQGDKRWFEGLKTRLKPLERDGTIDVWSDERILPGGERREEVNRRIRAADIFILILSADYFASDECHEYEMKAALTQRESGQARVIPILVSEVSVAGTPLDGIKRLPSDGKALSRWRPRDRGWQNVDDGLRGVIAEIPTRRRLIANHATSARRTALKLSMSEGKRMKLGLLLAAESARLSPSPENWSDLATAIASCPDRPLPPGLPEGLDSWALSPCGQHALLLRRGLREVFDLRTGRLVSTLAGTERCGHQEHHSEPGAFSPDGRLIVAVRSTNPDFASEQRTWPSVLKIWEAETGRLRSRVQGVMGTATFSRSGREILVDHVEDVAVSGLEGVSLKSLSRKPHQEMSVLDRRGSLSPDGELILAVNTEDRCAYIHGSDQVRVLVGHEHRIIHGEWSPDGRHLLTCSRDNTGRIWGRNGEVEAIFNVHRSCLTWGQWHPGGERVATVEEDGRCWVWDLKGRPLFCVEAGSSGVWFCTWSPTGSRLLLTGYNNESLRVFDGEGRLIGSLQDELDCIHQPRWHPDGTTLYGLGSDRKLGRWATIQEPVQVFALNGCVVGTAFIPGSENVIALDSRADRATIWDRSGNEVLSVPVPNMFSTNTSGVSPDGKCFATVSSAEGVRIWDMKGAQIGALQGHENHQATAWSVAWSPEGDRLLTTSNDGAARLWGANGHPLAVLGDHTWGVSYGAISPDGNHALTVCLHGTLRIWSLEAPFIPLSGSEAEEMKSEGLEGVCDTRERGMAALPNGPYMESGRLSTAAVAEGPSDGVAARLLAIWPWIVQRTCVGRWPQFSPTASEIILPWGVVLPIPSPGEALSGRSDLPAGADGPPLPPLFRLLGPDNQRAHDASYSPDGKLIATAHLDMARVWDREGNLLHELKGHVNSVWMTRFSSDGKRLVSVVDEGKVLQLWDMVEGRWLATLPGPPDPILEVSFSRNGQFILAHAVKTVPGWGFIEEGYVWLWPSDLEGLIELADSRVGRRLSDDERLLYLGS